MVFVSFHNVYTKVRVVGNGLKHSLDVAVKFSFKYLSSVFNAENKVAL